MSVLNNIKIEESWKNALSDEFQQPYFAAINQFILQEQQAGHTIFPSKPLIFNAFNATTFDKVKVVQTMF